ncbi:MAG: hypothetical protein OQJ80_02200 [Kangiella sp.]|nr:hypothetical protein [Kangiella sp.]
MKNLWLIISVVLMQISGCATLESTPEENAKVYLDDSNILHYEGKLSKEANQELFKLFHHSNTKPVQLSIDSTGGDVFLGLELAHWVYDNKINVHVKGLCASSCANYIFPAAKQKLLNKDSILLWHGGSLQPSASELIAEGDEGTIKWRLAEWRFYNKINVNPMISVYGSHRNIRISWYQYPLMFLGLYEQSFIGFDYSVEDMKKFGIRNIVLLDDEWDWRKHHEKRDIIKTKIMRVEVPQKDLSNPFTAPSEG